MADTILIPKDIPDWQSLLNDVEASVVDAENYALATSSFTDRNGNTFQKGAKGWSLDAQTAKDQADTTADLAKVYASVSGGSSDIYASTSGGLSATSDGEHFATRSGSTLTVYRNDSGSATQVAQFELQQYTDSEERAWSLRNSNGDEIAFIDKHGALRVSDVYVSRQQDFLADLSLLVRTILGKELDQALFDYRDPSGTTAHRIDQRAIARYDKIIAEGITIGELQARLDRLERAQDMVRTTSPYVHDTIKEAEDNGLDVNVDGLEADMRLAKATRDFSHHEETIDTSDASYAAVFGPVTVRVANNEWLVFYEGRKGGGTDKDPKSILYQRITYDDAADSWTFSGRQVLVAEGQELFGITGSNFNDLNMGSAVKLQKGTNAGRVVFHFGAMDIADFSTLDANYATIGQIYSDDNGQTWSTPTDILGPVYSEVPGTWDRIAPASQSLVEMRRGTANDGRLVQAFWNYDGSQNIDGVRTVYSDDQGSTWNAGEYLTGSGLNAKALNEIALAQARNGDLVASIRTNGERTFELGIALGARSSDGGQTFTPYQAHTQVTSETRTYLLQANQRSGDTADKLIFQSIRERGGGERQDLRVKLSYDNGHSFHIEHQILRGQTNYACIDNMTEGRFLIVDSTAPVGVSANADTIRLKTTSLSDILT